MMKLLPTIKRTILGVVVLAATCNYSLAQQTLDFNNTVMNIGSNGILFDIDPDNNPATEIPKGSDLSPLYTAALWVGGLDQGGQLHLAAMRYGTSGNDFFNGPYSSNLSYNDQNYQTKYGDSQWKVSKADVLNHINEYNLPGYAMPASIADWPGNGDASLGIETQLAPYVDVNNNGLYEPTLGDYPDIRGDEAVYVIINDVADFHSETGGEQIGLEIHLMYYQFASSDFKNEATYLHTKIYNRGTTYYPELKLGIFMDGDIGFSNDDYIGCDSLENMLFFYNGDAEDEGHYETLPPVFAVKSLNREMTASGYFQNGASFPQTDPNTAAQVFNYMNGFFSDGSPFYYGGSGYAGSTGATTYTTKYLFSGNVMDQNAWSMRTSNGGSPSVSSDMRGYMVVENQDLSPGDFQCNDFVFLYRGGGALDQNIVGMYATAANAQNDYDTDWRNYCTQNTLSVNEVSQAEWAVYPNPTNGTFTIDFGKESNKVVLKIVNSNGQVIQSITQSKAKQMTVDLETEPGIYFIQIQSETSQTVQKLIVE